VTQYSRH